MVVAIEVRRRYMISNLDTSSKFNLKTLNIWLSRLTQYSGIGTEFDR